MSPAVWRFIADQVLAQGLDISNPGAMPPAAADPCFAYGPCPTAAVGGAAQAAGQVPASELSTAGPAAVAATAVHICDQKQTAAGGAGVEAAATLQAPAAAGGLSLGWPLTSAPVTGAAAEAAAAVPDACGPHEAQHSYPTSSGLLQWSHCSPLHFALPLAPSGAAAYGDAGGASCCEHQPLQQAEGLQFQPRPLRTSFSDSCLLPSAVEGTVGGDNGSRCGTYLSPSTLQRTIDHVALALVDYESEGYTKRYCADLSHVLVGLRPWV